MSTILWVYWVVTFFIIKSISSISPTPPPHTDCVLYLVHMVNLGSGQRLEYDLNSCMENARKLLWHTIIIIASHDDSSILFSPVFVKIIIPLDINHNL